MDLRASWPSFLLLLATTGTAAAEAPAPAARMEVDAWGQSVDMVQQTRIELTSLLAAEAGTAGWEPVILRILEMEGHILPRLAGAADLDIQCGKNYRREHPDSSREQYQAFLKTAPGEKYETACIAEQLSQPEVDPKRLDGVAASLEASLVMPTLLQAVRSRRAAMGLPDVPELTPEMADSFPPVIEEAFGKSRCLIRELLKKVPVGKLLTQAEKLRGALQESRRVGRLRPRQALIRHPRRKRPPSSRAT